MNTLALTLCLIGVNPNDVTTKEDRQTLAALRNMINVSIREKEYRYPLRNAVDRYKRAGVFAVTDKQKIVLRKVLQEMEFPMWWTEDQIDKEPKVVYNEFKQALKENNEKAVEALLNLYSQRLSNLQNFGTGVGSGRFSSYFAQQEEKNRPRQSVDSREQGLKTWKAQITQHIKGKNEWKTWEDFVMARTATEANSRLRAKYSSRGIQVGMIYEVH